MSVDFCPVDLLTSLKSLACVVFTHGVTLSFTALKPHWQEEIPLWGGCHHLRAVSAAGLAANMVK